MFNWGQNHEKLVEASVLWKLHLKELVKFSETRFANSRRQVYINIHHDLPAIITCLEEKILLLTHCWELLLHIGHKLDIYYNHLASKHNINHKLFTWITYSRGAWEGGALKSSFGEQQQKCAQQPAPPSNTLQLSGPQPCVRNRFPLLSYLSQRKIPLLTHCWELLLHIGRNYTTHRVDKVQFMHSALFLLHVTTTSLTPLYNCS